LRCDPDSIILEANLDDSVDVSRVDPHFWCFARPDEFHGVANQVGDALGERSFVSEDSRQRLQDLYVRSRWVESWILLHDVAHEFIEIDGHNWHGDSGGAAVGEHILNEPV